MKDTSSEIEAQFTEILSQCSGSDRVRMCCDMFNLARALMTANIKTEYPNITDLELRAKIFERTYRSDFPPDELVRISAAIRHVVNPPVVDEAHRDVSPLDAKARAGLKQWLETWRRAGPLLEEERWARLRAMTEEDAQSTTRRLLEMWQPDWIGDDGEELLLHQRVFARARL